MFKISLLSLCSYRRVKHFDGSFNTEFTRKSFISFNITLPDKKKIQTILFFLILITKKTFSDITIMILSGLKSK